MDTSTIKFTLGTVIFILVIVNLRAVGYYFWYDSKVEKINSNLSVSTTDNAHCRTQRNSVLKYSFIYNDLEFNDGHPKSNTFSPYNSLELEKYKWLVIVDSTDPNRSMLVNSIKFSLDEKVDIAKYETYNYKWSFLDGVVIDK